MKTLAIISEYNPFHKGHALHIRRSKEITGADTVVALMSGSTVQRGSFAFFDKWQRAEIALSFGVDLVCELPYACCSQSAEYFAGGAVKILDALKGIDYLSFGSEFGNLPALQATADLLANESDAFQEHLHVFLNRGLSFAASREQAILEIAGSEAAATLRDPNNILGIEYLKALNRQKSTIEPITIRREGEGYHGQGKGFASATTLRQLLSMPHSQENTMNLTRQLPYAPSVLERPLALLRKDYTSYFYTTLAARLFSITPEELRTFPDVSEGLEFRLKEAAYAPDFSAFLKAASSRRVAESRIRRIALNLISGFSRENLVSYHQDDFLPWLRVLAMNHRGRALLRQIRSTTQIPIITNVRSNQTRLNRDQFDLFQFDLRATDLRSLFCDLKPTHHLDFSRSPVILD